MRNVQPMDRDGLWAVGSCMCNTPMENTPTTNLPSRTTKSRGGAAWRANPQQELEATANWFLAVQPQPCTIGWHQPQPTRTTIRTDLVCQVLLQALQPFALPSPPWGDALGGNLQIRGQRDPVALSQAQLRGAAPPNVKEREPEPREFARPHSHTQTSSVVAQGNQSTARNPKLNLPWGRRSPSEPESKVGEHQDVVKETWNSLASPLLNLHKHEKFVSMHPTEAFRLCHPHLLSSPDSGITSITLHAKKQRNVMTGNHCHHLTPLIWAEEGPAGPLLGLTYWKSSAVRFRTGISGSPSRDRM